MVTIHPVVEEKFDEGPWKGGRRDEEGGRKGKEDRKQKGKDEGKMERKNRF